MQRYKKFLTNIILNDFLCCFRVNPYQKESSVELVPDLSSWSPDQGISVSESLSNRLQRMV